MKFLRSANMTRLIWAITSIVSLSVCLTHVDANQILQWSQSHNHNHNHSHSHKYIHRHNHIDRISSSSSLPVLSSVLLDLRGGASKSRQKSKGGRTASLSSLNDNSSTISTKSKAASKSKAKDKKASNVNKTATGGTKVSGSNVKTSASKMSATMSKYKAILPLTRLYITLVTIFTIIGTILGDELTQALLALDPTRFIYGLELWRPLTAACFLGKPSIGWLFSTYFLYEYGSSLERSFGTAQHFVFLLGQVIFLSIASMLLGIPFFANSVITAMLHVLSRSMPHQKVKWLIFTVPYWSLPYGNMASDVLQSGSAASAVPHILGILSGHFYYFHKFIWPKTGGEDWLAAPQFLVNWLDPTSNQLSVSKKSIENALKKRKKGQGRKLGN